MIRAQGLLGLLAALAACCLLAACVGTRPTASSAPPGRVRVVRPATYESTVDSQSEPTVRLLYMFASRPVGDSGLNEDVWRTADEAILPLDVQARLREAGMRVAILSGQPPETLDILLREVPHHQLNGHELWIPSNRKTLIQTRAMKECPPELSKLIGTEPEAVKGPICFLKVVPTAQGDGSVDLHVTPIVQYGQVERHYVPEFGPGGVRQWTFENRRKEHEFRELSFRLRLTEDQTLLASCDPARENTLGWLLFVNPDESPPAQMLLLIQAAASTSR